MTTEIEKTISDLERQREAIDRAISALREITGTAPSTAKRTTSPKKAGKRRISPEGKARIAEAQRQRWAKKRAAEARASKKSGAPGMVNKNSRGKKRALKPVAKAAAPAPAKAAAASES